MTTLSPPRHRAALVLVVVAALAGLWPAPARAGDDPLAPTGDAARHFDFSGQVEVRWIDPAGEHLAVLAVTARDGVIDVDGPQAVVVDGRGRLIRDQQGWARLWPAGDAIIQADAPDPSEKYQESQSAGPPVAGRPTTEVVLSVRGQRRQVIDVDVATRLVLARTVLNPDGTTARTIRFDRLDVSRPAAGPAPPASRNLVPRAAPMDRLRLPFRAPRRLAAGYRRVGAYRSGDGLDVLYSDGIDRLSVFEVPGSLARTRLPGRGVPVRLGRSSAVLWTEPGGQVAAWQAGPMVYTAVGDGPPSEVLAAAASLPPSPSVSMSQRLRHACRRLIGELAGW